MLHQWRDPFGPNEAETATDIRMAGRTLNPVLRFRCFPNLKVIRHSCFDRMYRRRRGGSYAQQVTQVVEDLFPYFCAHTIKLPKQWRKDVETQTAERTSRGCQ